MIKETLPPSKGSDYSKRLKQRQHTPLFRKTSIITPSSPSPSLSSFDAHFEGEGQVSVQFVGQSDSRGCITSLHHNSSSLKDYRLAILDVFVELSLQKKRYALFNVTLREIENYLRDQNHLPSFPWPSGRHHHRSLLSWPGEWSEIFSREVGIALSRNLTSDAQETPTNAYTSLTLVEKIKAVEKALDARIRPILELDQGSIEFIDIKKDLLILSFGGRCEQCPSSQGGTLQFVEEILRRELQNPKLIATLFNE